MSRSTLLYAHKLPDRALGFRWGDLMSTALGTSYCGTGDVYRVRVRDLEPGEASPYWAWWEHADVAFRWVWPKKLLVQVCFPDLGESDVRQGRGEFVNVAVEEVLGVVDPDARRCFNGNHPRADGVCAIDGGKD